jgi:hypothetical protein
MQSDVNKCLAAVCLLKKAARCGDDEESEIKASDAKRLVVLVKAMVRSSRCLIGADAPTSWQAGNDPIK